jgi:O-acetyl-ADP-ribose deacetylase (regulator of RNase III)
MSDVLYHLRDRNLGLVAEWNRCFAGIANVETSHGDIFGDRVRADAIVSPANSFGYMDGGIDAVYLDRFGDDLQPRLQAVLRAEHDGELPVGQAVIVGTGDAEIPLLVSAPTMRIPGDVSGTVNAYLAFRAVIRAVRAHNQAGRPLIRSVLCPGLATAIGKMPYPIAAQQMLLAYLVAAEGRHEYHDRAFKAVYNHRAMLTGEPIRFATA